MTYPRSQNKQAKAGPDLGAPGSQPVNPAPRASSLRWSVLHRATGLCQRSGRRNDGCASPDCVRTGDPRRVAGDEAFLVLGRSWRLQPIECQNPRRPRPPACPGSHAALLLGWEQSASLASVPAAPTSVHRTNPSYENVASVSFPV